MGGFCYKLVSITFKHGLLLFLSILRLFSLLLVIDPGPRNEDLTQDAIITFFMAQ